MSCFYSNDLTHHGIKGQKWGVRRFQNPDGSWTEAGRKRYGDSPSNGKNNTNETKFFSKEEFNKSFSKASRAVEKIADESWRRRQQIERETGKRLSESSYKKLIAERDEKIAQEYSNVIEKFMKSNGLDVLNLDDLDTSSYMNEAYDMLSTHGKTNNVEAGWLNAEGKFTTDMFDNVETPVFRLKHSVTEGSTMQFTNDLSHHGIRGQRWGVRRYQNEDGSLTSAGKERYSQDQYNRDRSVYGATGARRIARNVERGESVSGARSKEADRIRNTRSAAATAGTVGRIAGGVAGGVGGYVLSKKINQYLPASLNDPAVKGMITAGVTATSAALGSKFGQKSFQAATMGMGGYSPTKYRYEN